MAEEQKKIPLLYQIVRGAPFPNASWFKKENIEEAMDFVPDDDDLIIASYPKTGTTWMQYIILQIRSKGQFYPSFNDVTFKLVPYIEMVGAAAVKAQPKPRFYKHHISYDKVQKNGKSKCVYIYRNPEDVAVSFFHFMRAVTPEIEVDFDTFFDHFASGKIGYGNYFRHVLSFYDHRKDENLLLVSYEKLYANRKEEVLRVAKFLGEDYYNCLIQNDQLLDGILERTSFDYMKKNLTLTHPESKDKPAKINFFRKGIVGDGKNALTECQRQRLKAAAEEILTDTSIIKEWYSE